MLQIPKNVMQIGDVNPHAKIYMEDYVHTFLERRKGAEEYLAFGKKEEHSGVLYYLIYGVEKRTDWDRGSYPYFKRLERIGTIEKTKEHYVFKPVRGAGISLDGYFVFYEQNEDMQSYMIVVRETEEIAGSEEKEDVMEAVRTHREQQRQALDVKQKHMRKKRRSFPIPARALRLTKMHTWTIPDLCRAGSLVLLLLLVATGLTSLSQYPDMKAVVQLFSDAAKRDEIESATTKSQEKALVVEETVAEAEEYAKVTEAVMDEADTEEDLVLAEEITGEADGEIQWMIGQQDLQDTESRETEPAGQSAEEEEQTVERIAKQEEDQTEKQTTEDVTEESATQAIARPTSYVVKKGDSLAEIARKFYGNAAMVTEICDINQIENPDHICPGQNILLP